MVRKKVIVFTNVIFEQFGNQSIKNFVEGFLLKGYHVLLVTVHTQGNAHMQEFMSRYPNFEIVYLLGISQSKGTKQSTSKFGSISQKTKQLVKQIFTYRNRPSNSQVFQWLSIFNTVSVMRKLVAYIKTNPEKFAKCEKYIFIDVFGGQAAKYIKTFYRSFWKEISPRTVGYYLGTVLKQYGNNTLLAFLTMPISFFGSYKVPIAKLIITDDGTCGETVFRGAMRYKGPILFIRNGIDERLSSFQPVEKRVEDSGVFSFVTCSRLTYWKRVDRAIRFIYYLKNELKKPVRLTIIGEGEERASLENLVHSLGLCDIVTFTGPMKYQEALSCISKNTYYIIFNDLSNMGNQIYESVHLGLIPVTIDDGSTDSVLENNCNSIKFPMCTEFEKNAASLFISHLEKNNREVLERNIANTREKIYTWRERNDIEQEFMFRND